MTTQTTDRRTLLILSFALVVVTLGYGIVIPVFPFVIEVLGGSGRDMGMLVALAALMELLFGPVWGSISDRVGRKRILMVGIAGYGLSLLGMGLARRMWVLIASRALSGVLTAATMPTAMAYVGESTSTEERGAGIGLLGAASGLGIILGPGVGGWLGGTSLSLPFFVGAALAFVSLLLVSLLLPRSQYGEAGAAFASSSTAPAASARENWIVRAWRSLSGSAGFPLLLLFIASLGLANFEAVFGLYAARTFGYGPERVGTILLVIGVVTTLGKGLLTGPATRRWGDGAVVKGSMIAGGAGYLILLAAYDYLTVLLATGFFILSKTVLRPALLSLISKRSGHGPGGGLGTLMGAGNTVVSLGRVIGPIWAGFAFDLDPRYPYLSGAAVLAIGFIISLFGLSGEAGRAV
ncbi:MAG: MFS transporter [Anaerolineae bacterium]|nr:MFS transporter [Anaerolineae bacterium]